MRMVNKRHKVFISYHHDADQAYADKLRELYGGSAIIDKSMYDDLSDLQTDTILNKIRKEHLLDSTVTIVLVGEHTWGRKWVDWEIYASLRPYAERTRNGLVCVYLPNHRNKHFRLMDNIQSGYAVAIKWDKVGGKLIDAIHQAWNNRKRPELINNTRPLRERNAPLEKKNYSSHQENDGCFIATAAFGTPLAPEIDILRWWRDQHLMNKKYGRFLISSYYKHSPSIAESVRKYKLIRAILRKLIRIVIYGLKMKYRETKFDEVMK